MFADAVVLFTYEMMEMSRFSLLAEDTGSYSGLADTNIEQKTQVSERISIEGACMRNFLSPPTAHRLYRWISNKEQILMSLTA